MKALWILLGLQWVNAMLSIVLIGERKSNISYTRAGAIITLLLAMVFSLLAYMGWLT